MVSLAVVIHQVISVADCFHFKYCINKLLCLSLAGKLRWSSIKVKQAREEKNNELINDCSDQYAYIQFHTDLYIESMSNISQILHPFYQGNRINTIEFAESEIHKELSNIKQVIDNCKITDKYKLFTKAENQVSDVVSVIVLKNKAINLCRKFQRASSQVEGRNGYLSAINHNQRSFDSKQIKSSYCYT